MTAPVDSSLDFASLLGRWGKEPAAEPRAQSALQLSELASAIDAELGARADAVRPLLDLVRAHTEALFPDKAQAGAAAPLSAEEQEERMAALFLLLDVIEDAVLAIGLTPPGPRSQSTPPPRREEPAR